MHIYTRLQGKGIDSMEERIIFFLGILISNMILVNIISNFVREHYNYAYSNKAIYYMSYSSMVILLCLLNYVQIPAFNFITCVLIAFISSVVLFTSDDKRAIIRFAETSVLIFILAFCESIGVIVVSIINPKDIESQIMYSSLTIMFSNIIVMFLYYILIKKLWMGKSNSIHYHVLNRKLLYIILINYNFINIILIVAALPLMNGGINRIILLINMAFMVIVDMCLLFYISHFGENEKLKIELKLLEQQEKIDYVFYNGQKIKYDEINKVLHDVNKHINMIEKLYLVGESKKALQYTKEINSLLNPLVADHFTDHVYLNILLNEKKKQAEYSGIRVTYCIGEIKLDFMKPIDVITLFGNLIDNAIEACIKSKCSESFVYLRIDTYNNMIIAEMRNSCMTIGIWKSKYPVSTKEKHKGIGLLNIETVISKYNGNMIIKEENNIFYCDLFWNKE